MAREPTVWADSYVAPSVQRRQAIYPTTARTCEKRPIVFFCLDRRAKIRYLGCSTPPLRCYCKNCSYTLGRPPRARHCCCTRGSLIVAASYFLPCSLLCTLIIRTELEICHATLNCVNLFFCLDTERGSGDEAGRGGRGVGNLRNYCGSSARDAIVCSAQQRRASHGTGARFSVSLSFYLTFALFLLRSIRWTRWHTSEQNDVAPGAPWRRVLIARSTSASLQWLVSWWPTAVGVEGKSGLLGYQYCRFSFLSNLN